MQSLSYALDQRRLWVAPRVANVDDEGNPAIVDDSLSATLTLLASVAPAQRRETYASEFDGLDDPFLYVQQLAESQRGTGGGRSPSSLLRAFWVFVARREGRVGKRRRLFLRVKRYCG